MISRLATALGKFPSEVRKTMTLPQVYDLFEYWQTNPPEHELIAMLARVYTTWSSRREPMDPVQAEKALRASQEERWRSGAAMSAKHLFDAMGGALSFDGSKGKSLTGGEKLPGIGPFPGTVH